MKLPATLPLLFLFLTHITALPLPTPNPNLFSTLAKVVGNTIKHTPSGTLKKVYNPHGILQHIEASIDPKKAPLTAENIRNHVQAHGPGGMTAKMADMKSTEEAKKLRTEALKAHRKVPGQKDDKFVDECPPAMMRVDGGPCTTKATTRTESTHQGAVLSQLKQALKKEGTPTTTFTHGIIGENLDKFHATFEEARKKEEAAKKTGGK